MRASGSQRRGLGASDDDVAFDVAVVGGGAAGCMIAARLAESGSRSVVLLEAGPDVRASLPEAFRDGWRIPKGFDWGFAAEPDVRGEVEELTRGKLLGGTSWMTRFAFRGAAADYDAWAALGNPGWGFDEVLPWFARLEADADFGDQPWHGASGSLPISRYLDLDLSEIAGEGLQALEAVGFPQVADHNRPGAVGVGRMPMSSVDGRRVTTADAWLPLDPASNLTVQAGAHVAEVLFEQTRATGVRLVGGDVVRAGWVVLCAGTYGSPTVLLRSGIGPAEHLRPLGIAVRADLPGVGENLADHRGVDIDCGYRGPAREAPILHVVATFRSSVSSGHAAPDLMLWLSDPRGDPPSFEIDVVLLTPRARGTVRLRSADPTAAPLIELPNASDPIDIERLVEGLSRGLEVANRPEIRRLCTASPSPVAREIAELPKFVRTESYSFPHVVGTCSMGPDPDDGAVVDATGRVHGFEHLSVADASVIPIALSAFTHLPTIMLAERIAERIAAVL